MEDIITKEEWQSGAYRKREDCKTQEGYYKAVEKFVEKYGVPTKKDMLLCRSGQREEEQEGYGCSFTTNVNVCRNLAKRAMVDTIWWCFIPKGTKAVHIAQNGLFEEEYVIPINKRSLSPLSFGRFATLEGELDYMASDFEVEGDFEKWKLCINQWFLFHKSLFKSFGIY